MTTKLLPTSYPLITSWPWVAGLLSILGPHKESYPWIFSNYINIFCKVDAFNPELLFIDYAPKSCEQLRLCPWVEYHQVKRGLLLRSGASLANFIKEALRSNYYISVVMDQKELPITPYGKLHETLIYGYDENEEMCYVADFTFSQSGKYTFTKVPFESVVKACLAVSDEADFSDGIRLLRYDPTANYAFDKSWVKKSLLYYVNSNDAYSHYCETFNKQLQFSHGISVYDCILQASVKSLEDQKPLDARAIQNKYDHIVMMQHRIQYMLDMNFLDDSSLLVECQSIARQLDILRFRAIASRLFGPSHLKLDFPECIRALKDAETYLIHKLVAAL